MYFKKGIITNKILKIKQFILGFDSLIKSIEYIRGLYRYPNKMLGRKLKLNNINFHTDLLVIAAHPDDDILGLSTTLYRHTQQNNNIKVLFVTNGTQKMNGSWRNKVTVARDIADLRYKEAIAALSLINIPYENIFCLGYPDGGTHRYLNNISMDVDFLFKKFNPGRVYVHCIEGGHVDHDMTSYVVNSICKKTGYTNLFEWTEYNPQQPIGSKNVKFLCSNLNEFKQINIKISEEERILKRNMLAIHKSQDVERFYLQGEALRKANTSKSDLALLEHCMLSKKRLKNIIKDYEITSTKQQSY